MQNAKEILTYTFRVSPEMFRRALYFNTFFKQRIQVVLVIVMWAMGLGLAAANLICQVEMSSVMQLCYVVLLVTLPLLVFSCEHGYRQYKASDASKKMRTVSLGREWIKFRIGGAPESEKVEWRQMSGAFELERMFVLYRDSNLMIVIPKDVIPDDEIDTLRKILRLNLGRSFRIRVGRLVSALCG